MTYKDFIQYIVETRGQWADEVRYSIDGCERHHIIPKSKGEKPEVLNWELRGIGINITAGAIRKLVYDTDTYSVYSMYPEVFDNLTWEYKEGSSWDEN